MKWLKLGGGVLLVVLALLAVIPFFLSLDDYIPTLEREISARIREPVRIVSLKASGLPLPHVTISGITVGKTDDIKVGSVTVTPDLWTLASSTRVIRSIEIGGLVMTQKALDRIPAWTKTDTRAGVPTQPPAVRVKSVSLDDAMIKLHKVSIGPFDARLSLAADGNPESASIVTQDGKLTALIKPDGAKYLVEVSGKEWKLPLGPALHFDELAIKGVATFNDINLNDIRAKLYSGSMTGRLAAGWDRGIRMKGSAEVNQVEIKPLLQALGKPATMSGKLTARPVVFSASAARADQIGNALLLSTPFDIQSGVLHGIDINKAATSLISKEGGKGGETRFDKLSGHLALDRGTRRFTRLNVAAGSLSADGDVTVTPRDELSGRVNAKVGSGSVTTTTVPLNVSGTVESPLLLPTGATVTGAAVGTAILGPGFGTSLGSKAGQWTESLFNKKEEKKK